MAEKPILFSTPMVQAIMEGRKTMTRRIVKGMALDWLKPDMFTPEYVASPENGLCPYGQLGDLLWVRETFYAYGHWATITENGKSKKQFWDLTRDSCYLHQFHSDWLPNKVAKFGELGWHKRPSLYMPKSIARIWLRVKDRHVERLQDINEQDAIAEGIEYQKDLNGIWYKNYNDDDHELTSDPIDSFQSLWISINGRESWDLNPFVWVVSFEVVSKTGKHSDTK